MDVLRHQNIPGHYKAIPHTYRLKFSLEDAVSSLPRQQRLPVITTEGRKIKTTALLVTNKHGIFFFDKYSIDCITLLQLRQRPTLHPLM